LNEALGHGNRAAKFLDNSSAFASKPGSDDALVLERNAKATSRRASSRRESYAADPLSQCIAEFSRVTVTNPFNVTLIHDLSMKVMSRMSSAQAFALPSSYCIKHLLILSRYSVVRAVLFRGPQVCDTKNIELRSLVILLNCALL
jgi:hypothetical protein